MTESDFIETRLHEVAHARAGDKGNRSNISLIPYNASVYKLLKEQVTENKVLALFSHKGATNGKSLSSLLLTMDIKVPGDLLTR